MKLKKVLSYSDKNQIWRLLISENDYLVIETRDVEEKEVHFHCINLLKGKKVFKNLQLEEKFWVGIEHIYKGIIFFHSFAKPNMPEHKKIIAFDLENQAIIWQNDDLTYLARHEDKIYAFRKKFEGRDVYALDYKTGEIINELGGNSNEITNLLEYDRSNEDFEDYKYPEPIENLGLNNKFFIENIKNKNSIENIETIRFENIVCINYHEKKENFFDNHLVIYDIEKEKKLFTEILNKNLNSFSPDSFFGYKNFIIALKDKIEIILLKVV